MTTTPAWPTWLEPAIDGLQRGDMEPWLGMYTPDAVHEFPFAAQGNVERLTGWDDIAAYMRKLPEFIRFGTVTLLTTREVGDETIIEGVGNHHNVADGSAREVRYVWFITRYDGKITHVRDYMNFRSN